MEMYHVTKKENLPSILEKGLICTSGDNARLFDSKFSIVAFSDLKSLPMWLILLNGDTILKADLDLESTIEGQYGNSTKTMYSEYIMINDIPVSKLTVVTKEELDITDEVLADAMKLLCRQYIEILGSMTETLAICYDYNNVRYAYATIDGLYSVLERLDFSSLSDEEKIEIFQDQNIMSFASMLGDKPLYQHLIDLRDSKRQEYYTNAINKLYSYIIANFSEKVLMANV